jgi:hypothetical protein
MYTDKIRTVIYSGTKKHAKQKKGYFSQELKDNSVLAIVVLWTTGVLFAVLFYSNDGIGHQILLPASLQHQSREATLLSKYSRVVKVSAKDSSLSLAWPANCAGVDQYGWCKTIQDKQKDGSHPMCKTAWKNMCPCACHYAPEYYAVKMRAGGKLIPSISQHR